MFNFNKTDKYILVISGLVIILFSYFLYDDSILFNKQLSNSYKSIGVLNQSSNDVRRKIKESFSWSPASLNETLFEKDSIFTGESSSAEIKLSDGSVIYLNENSLVTLNFNDNNLELNLKYGNIQTEIKSDSKVQIKSGNDIFKINTQDSKNDRSKLEIKKPKMGQAKIKLLDGNIKIEARNQKPIELKKQETLVVNSNTGEIKKTPPAKIQLITQSNAVINLINSQQTFLLNWTSENAENTRLLISNKADFSNLVYSEFAEDHNSPIKNLPPGSYYWKITALDLSSKPISSKINQFRTTLSPVVTIVSPKNNARFAYEFDSRTASSSHYTKLEWSAKYSEYQFQLSSSDKFEDFVADQKTKNSSIFQSLNNGKYYFRVRGFISNIPTDWSLTHSFEILGSEKKIIKPATPVLAQNKISYTPENSRGPASVKPININWKPAKDAKKYQVEISETPDFNSPSIQNTKETSISIKPSRVGKNYYRVKAISSENESSEYSETGELLTTIKFPIIERIEPVTYKTFNLSESPPEVELKINWQNVPFASQYKLEYSKFPDFKNASSQNLTSNSHSFKTKDPGSYYFRILALDNNNSKITEFSKPEIGSYLFLKKLNSPSLIEPKNNFSLFLQNDIKPMIWLSWQKQDKALKYEVELASDKDFKNIIDKQVVNDRKFLIKSKLPMGQIYWRVKSHGENEELQSDWSQSGIFNLYHAKNEETYEE